MAYDALRKYSDRDLTVRFVSNVDANDFHEKTLDLDPEETLFIVCSKTFTTLETMTNARTARAWMTENGGDPAKQFAALSTAQDKTSDFGIDADQVFGFEDWVGTSEAMDASKVEQNRVRSSKSTEDLTQLRNADNCNPDYICGNFRFNLTSYGNSLDLVSKFQKIRSRWSPASRGRRR